MATFKINGQDTAVSNLPPIVQKVMQYAQSLPAGELQTTAEVARAIQVAVTTLSNRTNAYPELEPYRVRYQSKLLWGSTQTIKAFRKEILK